MSIKDIRKKKIISIDITRPVKEASQIMSKENIGFLPITQDGNIVGVITDRDIAIRGLVHDHSSIEEIMSKQVIAVDKKDSLKKALEAMANNKIKRVLVKDKENYIGVLSISDILKSNRCNKEVLKTIKQIFSVDKKDTNVKIDTFEL